MSAYVPTKEHLRTILLYFFNIEKRPAEAHRLLVTAYAAKAPSRKTCENWYQRFKTGDFGVTDKDRPGKAKKFEDIELQTLLDRDSCQTQQQLAEQLGVSRFAVGRRLRALGKILKEGQWVPHEVDEGANTA